MNIGYLFFMNCWKSKDNI